MTPPLSDATEYPTSTEIQNPGRGGKAPFGYQKTAVAERARTDRTDIRRVHCLRKR